jgi:hypothetical protein
MEKRELEILLTDYSALATRSDDPELVAIGAALFIEQTFGIALSDSDISAENLGAPESVRRFVLERRGG